MAKQSVNLKMLEITGITILSDHTKSPSLGFSQSKDTCILPAAIFIAKLDLIEVYSGYLIRGESRKENGNNLIDAINAGLVNSIILS